MPRVSVSGGWYHTRNYNAVATFNAARSPSDYTSFQTPNPLTGEPLTIYRLNAAALGKVDTVDSSSSINHRAYTGYEVNVLARPAGGGSLLAGVAIERTVTVVCDTNNPNLWRFCDQTGTLQQDLGQVPGVPFRTEFKLAGSYPLPWGFLAAASLFSYAGAVQLNAAPTGSNTVGAPNPPGWAGPLNVLWAVPANLFPGGRTEVVTVPLIAPGTQYLQRWNQLDVNIKRSFRAGRFEFQPAVEIYNLLNSSVVLNQNQNFGPALGTPSLTAFGRFMKLGALIRF